MPKIFHKLSRLTEILCHRSLYLDLIDFYGDVNHQKI